MTGQPSRFPPCWSFPQPTALVRTGKTACGAREGLGQWHQGWGPRNKQRSLWSRDMVPLLHKAGWHHHWRMFRNKGNRWVFYPNIIDGLFWAPPRRRLLGVAPMGWKATLSLNNKSGKQNRSQGDNLVYQICKYTYSLLDTKGQVDAQLQLYLTCKNVNTYQGLLVTLPKPHKAEIPLTS